MKIRSWTIRVKKNDANDNEFPFLVCQKECCVTQMYHYIGIMSPYGIIISLVLFSFPQLNV
jgi:hypothetical protein